ncbi:MAG: hypothetical protein A2941_01640 [Candidatus Yanofskybacteria bacterium RIFCSPLOWO2_01_FULL_49_17]|uniref:BioF2-like acetyltransferase domain-containing protein n=1 Tax=Candidatus Yanofskybacteria bacterium RIFCSPLOWO2_01_FULL_49_17 TaxID=1802700 RepID=A0A1F8GQH1_9BACT|nr:MAG: hypothetical protein A2941_01640 [Candidatus Yanofskybacteria bacterium RIFCSPLOWO2_01_FULL_49_17]
MRSFLQSKEWADFQRAIGRPVFHYDKDGTSAYIVRHDLPFRKNYLYIPHGPEIKVDEMAEGIRNELSQFVSYLKNLAREQKSFYIKMEPLDDKVPELMHQFGFKKSKKELQPKRTVVLDLTKSEEDLLAAMHYKTRYNIKVAEKHSLKFIAGKNLDAFWKLLKQTAKKNNFFTHTREYYEKLCNIPGLPAETIFIGHDDVPITGAVWLAYGDTAYYLHGAMDRSPEYKPMMAPYALHWGMIKYLKAQGIQKYDFWGIDAQRYPGVTRFKLGWGGHEVEYPGSFDLPISNFWYYAYKLINKFR